MMGKLFQQTASGATYLQVIILSVIILATIPLAYITIRDWVRYFSDREVRRMSITRICFGCEAEIPLDARGCACNYLRFGDLRQKESRPSARTLGTATRRSMKLLNPLYASRA